MSMDSDNDSNYMELLNGLPERSESKYQCIDISSTIASNPPASNPLASDNNVKNSGIHSVSPIINIPDPPVLNINNINNNGIARQVVKRVAEPIPIVSEAASLNTDIPNVPELNNANNNNINNGTNNNNDPNGNESDDDVVQDMIVTPYSYDVSRHVYSGRDNGNVHASRNGISTGSVTNSIIINNGLAQRHGSNVSKLPSPSASRSFNLTPLNLFSGAVSVSDSSSSINVSIPKIFTPKAQVRFIKKRQWGLLSKKYGTDWTHMFTNTFGIWCNICIQAGKSGSYVDKGSFSNYNSKITAHFQTCMYIYINN